MGNGENWKKLDTCLKSKKERVKKINQESKTQKWFALRSKRDFKDMRWGCEGSRHGENSRGFLLPRRPWRDGDNKQNIL